MTLFEHGFLRFLRNITEARSCGSAFDGGCRTSSRTPSDNAMKTIHRLLADGTAAIAIDTRLIAAGNSKTSGIYVFLISFACVYYVSNAPLVLGHYDLGWHLAAGDLIRERGHIPVQDPWSFTSGGSQWYNLSWLWDVIASVLFQYRNLAASCSL